MRTHINATPTEKQEKPLYDRPAARTRPSPDLRPTKIVNRGGNRRGAHRPRRQAGPGQPDTPFPAPRHQSPWWRPNELPHLTDQATAVTAALAELDVHPTDRVLIMLPDGPGFAEAFAGAIEQGVVPLPVHPLLPAHDLVTVAAEAGAHVVLASVDQIPALAELDAEPPVLINGPHGIWAAALRLR